MDESLKLDLITFAVDGYLYTQHKGIYHKSKVVDVTKEFDFTMPPLERIEKADFQLAYEKYTKIKPKQLKIPSRDEQEKQLKTLLPAITLSMLKTDSQ
jgi:hypothetical protein